MRVFITGATGFVGRALTLRLLGLGHEVVCWVRSLPRARKQLGAGPQYVDAAGGDEALRQAIAGVDAVVNLAGEPVIGGRWSDAKKARLVSSRVDLTDAIVAAMVAARAGQGDGAGPGILLSASAVGYYGDRGADILTEAAPPSDDFLADLCRRWEAAALAAVDEGVRVATFRIGIVLGAEGGALGKMLPAFRAGVGGRIGDGNQWVSWVHLHDLVAMFVGALTDDRWRGPHNAVAPHPVSNREMTRAIGRALGRPTFVPVPGFALRMLMGEAAGPLLTSQRVEPVKARALEFSWEYETIEVAVDDLLRPEGGPTIGAPGERPSHPYLERRGASYLLENTAILEAPLDDVFAFFSMAENLSVLTPPWMGFDILTPLPIAMADGTRIEYRVRVGPVPMRWRTVIERWEPQRLFVDAQHKGPYRSWFHEHRFEADGDRTRMVDRVYYSPPLGLLGRLANRFFVAPMLRRIFAYRNDGVALRFGVGG